MDWIGLLVTDQQQFSAEEGSLVSFHTELLVIK